MFRSPFPLAVAVAALSACNCGVEHTDPARPAIATDPASIAFGELPTGSFLDRTVTVTNSGAAALHVNDARLEDDTRGAFAVIPSTFEVPAASSYPVTIRYSASSTDGAD